MKKQFCIGNITNVRFHYVNMKYALNSWGNARKSFDKECYIFTNHPVYDSIDTTIDESLKPDKYYAYIEIDINNQLSVRNLFDSKHEKGFNQKNTYFSDDIYYDLFLDDKSNLIDSYLAFENVKRDNNWILYYCVEYEPTANIDLILYCSELERINSCLEDRLRIINIQKDMEINKAKKSWFSFLKKTYI